MKATMTIRQILGAAITVGVAAVAARRPRVKATASGTAVSASARLRRVSPSRATELLRHTTTACRTAVTARAAKDTASAWMPLRLVSSWASTATAASWLCGATRCRSHPRSLDGWSCWECWGIRGSLCHS